MNFEQIELNKGNHGRDMLSVGKAGEHLVCFDLLLKGFNVTISSENLPYDILLDVNGVILKVQVKTTFGPKNYKGSPFDSTPRYVIGTSASRQHKRSKYNIGDIDMFAIVDLETRNIAYIDSRDKIPATVTLRADKYKGKYYNEVIKEKVKEIIKLRDEGSKLTEIGSLYNITPQAVSHLIKNPNGAVQGTKNNGPYFSDLIRNRQWFIDTFDG